MSYFEELEVFLTITLVHPPDHSVDLVLPVASISSLHKVCGLLVHTTAGWRQLEGPQEVVGGLEVLSNCVNLMDEILNTDDAIFACRCKCNMFKKLSHTRPLYFSRNGKDLRNQKEAKVVTNINTKCPFEQIWLHWLTKLSIFYLNSDWMKSLSFGWIQSYRESSHGCPRKLDMQHFIL